MSTGIGFVQGERHACPWWRGRALARADELGTRPLAAHCHVGLGRFYRRIGKRDPAAEHLTTATSMHREISMGLWLEQAEAAPGLISTASRRGEP